MQSSHMTLSLLLTSSAIVDGCPIFLFSVLINVIHVCTYMAVYMSFSTWIYVCMHAE
jgi:hypothetical protein